MAKENFPKIDVKLDQHEKRMKRMQDLETLLEKKIERQINMVEVHGDKLKEIESNLQAAIEIM